MRYDYDEDDYPLWQYPVMRFYNRYHYERGRTPGDLLKPNTDLTPFDQAENRLISPHVESYKRYIKFHEENDPKY